MVPIKPLKGVLIGALDSWYLSSLLKGVLIGGLDRWYISSLLIGVLICVMYGVSLDRGGFKT